MITTSARALDIFAMCAAFAFVFAIILGAL